MLKRARRVAKQLLAVGWIGQTYEGANRAVVEVFGASRVLTHVFAFVSVLTFSREEFGVVRGRRNYYRNKKRERVSHVELRRNIHRLEKGIIMVPRRDIFARDYIAETIEFYERAVDQHRRAEHPMEPSELEWAHNVLFEYFRVSTGQHPIVDSARARFLAVGYAPSSLDKVPHPKESISTVSYEQLVGLAQQRRSTRWFADRPVPRDLIDQALMVARQAPTACNRLPYEFRVFDDPDMVRTVSSIPFGAAGYAHNIPVIVAVIGSLDNYFSPRDRHAIYVDSSLAAMSFLFGLETVGLSSSVINWPDFEPLEAKMQKTLSLDATERVVMLIALGYADPDGLVPFSQKKELDTFRSYNRIR